MTTLPDVHDDIAAVAARVGPATVGLGRGWGRGSGLVVADGRVLTTAHHLGGDPPNVVFADGRREATEVAGADHDLDLAVLSVPTGEIDPVPVGVEPFDVTIGTPVVALADPGGRGLRATLGHVSSEGQSFRGPRGRRISGGIEHTAPLPRGSAGGPLVDVHGALIGVNALRRDGGLILAVPTTGEVGERIAGLARGEAPRTRRLGVAVAPPRTARGMRRAVGLPEREGVLVRAVEEGSPGARAGLAPGDLIVAADGREMTGLDALYAALEELEAGPARLSLTLVRGSEEREATVDFAPLDQEGGTA